MNTYEEYQETIRKIPTNAECPVKKAISMLQGKWSPYVLFELSKEHPQRFKSLQKRIDGITNTMLTATLRDLEEKGFITRIQFNEIPPHVEYSLTEAGINFYKVFEALAEWSIKYIK